jgi:hypothetical protein
MEDELTRPVVVVGGTGVFGSRLAEGLKRDGVRNLIITGRSEAALMREARRLGCAWARIDIASDDLGDRLGDLTPFAVIDAAGPFQSYDGDRRYALAHACIGVGAHYVDLSDDASFTNGIQALDDAARASEVAVLSGVSSVPALSAAAVGTLSRDLVRIDMIDSMILPGNRAPRGRSVMAAILAQVGQPLPGGAAHGWIGVETIRLETGTGAVIERLASPIGAPDLVLMPERFDCPDVRFRAGLELKVMHRGLGVLARMVRLGLLRSASPLLGFAFPLARLLEPFGTDVGAMRVLVRGENADGQRVERQWTLIAKSGDGPHVPAIPGRAIVRKLLAGEIAPGARACLDDLTLEECEMAAPERAISFSVAERRFEPLFEGILGDGWSRLPAPVRALHEVAGSRVWCGAAAVTRNQSPAARLVAWLFGFPPEADETPVTVRMRREADEEIWTRDFGGHRFLSRLSGDPGRPGRMWERFGPFRFAIDFRAGPEGLEYPVSAGRFLGIPIPSAFLPRSDTREAVDEKGRATFDVALSVPLVGPIVRYRGWLSEGQPIMGVQELTVS